MSFISFIKGGATHHNLSQRKGFTILYATLVASIVLAIGLAIFNISLKELQLSTIGRESQAALNAADAGAECALLWDRVHPGREGSVFGYESPLNEGLVGYWAFDEGGGSTVADGSGNGHDGTLINMEPGDWISGQSGQALHFDGVDEYIDASGAETSLNGLTEVSLSLWVRADTTGVDSGFITGHSGLTTDTGLSGRYDAQGWSGGGNNLLKLGFGNATGGDAANSQHESADGTQTTAWQHIVATWEGGQPITLYLDTVEDAPTDTTSGGTSLANFDTLYIGRGVRYPTFPSWDGVIDEVRIYDRILTQDDIDSLYNFVSLGDPAPQEPSDILCNGASITDPGTGWDDESGWDDAPQAGENSRITFDLAFNDGSCALVTVVKEDTWQTTTIESIGRNTCEPAPNAVERGILVEY